MHYDVTPSPLPHLLNPGYPTLAPEVGGANVWAMSPDEKGTMHDWESAQIIVERPTLCLVTIGLGNLRRYSNDARNFWGGTLFL